MNIDSHLTNILHENLQKYWGYSQFREDQEAIISSVVQGQDVLALLPTGGGKSLCYQLPAIILEGTCLVISPLLALIKDQVSSLEELGVEAEFLSSEFDDAEVEDVFTRCIEGFTKVLYVSPERLKNQEFLRRIPEINISFIAVDEAHCISEWGQDFRPSYQNIKFFREEFKNVPLLALTATATSEVVEEIVAKLSLKKVQIFKKSFERNNLNIISVNITDKYQKIKDFLLQNRTAGIIYTRTRKEAEELSHFLQNSGLEQVNFYHAGLPRKDKERLQKQWQASHSRVLVSTNAFGMGIDKDNVRFVIHFSPSASIENYYQEIGRAGRDGEESIAYLFWNDQELQEFDAILKNQIPTKVEYQSILRYLYSIYQIAEHDLPEKMFTLKIDRVKNLSKTSRAKILNVLNFLHNQELIYYKNTWSPSTIESLVQADNIDLLPAKDAHFLELLYRTVSGLGSGKVHFSEKSFCEKHHFDSGLFKERLEDMQKAGHLEYFDGANHAVRFLKPRDENRLFGFYWKLFSEIQQNKLKKWKQMKFYVTSQDYCRMRLILRYFDEKNAKDCGKCDYCQKKSPIASNTLLNDILLQLTHQPRTLVELVAIFKIHSREKILENLIFLLDLGKIRMLNYKTYTINS
ncbi:RecQ family ATP-dependent DNA helicase [Chryseobacterium sp. POL2]|uniref:RecQ family ATP-dependent DNA helicase n=1 Tax=Chryseobacterium sp. POL2 TaxID=2713414 RepID=UPI0013E13142|nr:RecQ family ATP-dependent DNA helicase [Chryseobacterium sp. POL2]QIG89408.1 RecQ family ATP-dependent DNA helicase [Chryseobacterium sp. POL2]